MHAGFGGFDNFASSWIVLIVVPWACAVAASYDLLPSRRRVGGRLAPVPLLVALADVLLVVAFLAL